MSIPEGMIANNVATTPCRGLSLSRYMDVALELIQIVRGCRR
jgi:hypothetical protein